MMTSRSVEAHPPRGQVCGLGGLGSTEPRGGTWVNATEVAPFLEGLPDLNGQNSSQLRNTSEAVASLFHRISGSGASSRHSVGTCTKLTRSLYMDERHQQARQLYIDRRHEKAHDRQILRDAVSCRMQSYFITLRATFPCADANALLQRVELQSTPREHRGG
jgi:hypothetical protein